MAEVVFRDRVSYLFCYSCNIPELADEVGELNDTHEISVRARRNNLAVVNTWLGAEGEEEVQRESHRIQKAAEEVGRSRLSKCSLSRDAVKTTKSAKMDKKEERKRWIQHYNSSQKILLVGEGDFSFSACLAKAFGTAVNLVATSLHPQEILPVKHWTSQKHLEELEELGCLVLHEIDVYNMNQHHILRYMKFDVIIFNFPHAGHFSWLTERDTTLINMHQELVKAYFTSAREMLHEGGEIHVTHRDDYPYNRWKLKKLARKTGLDLKEKVEFSQANYPGYHNKRGININCNKKFPLNQCFTFKFTLRLNVLGVNSYHEVTENASSDSSSILTTLEDLHI